MRLDASYKTRRPARIEISLIAVKDVDDVEVFEGIVEVIVDFRDYHYRVEYEVVGKALFERIADDGFNFLFHFGFHYDAPAYPPLSTSSRGATS